MTRAEKSVLQALLTGTIQDGWDQKALSRLIRKRMVQPHRSWRRTSYRLTAAGTRVAVAVCRALPPVRPNPRWFARKQGPTPLDRWDDRYGQRIFALEAAP